MTTSRDEFRYDTLIFDVGGTLIGFHEAEPFRVFLQHAGLPATEEDARAFHRRLMAILLAERHKVQGQGAQGQELRAWWQANFHLAWPGRPDLAEEMLDWLFAGRFDRLFADVLPTLEMLRAAGISMGVLSNFGPHLEDVLQGLDVRAYFDFVIISAVVGIAKPDRRVFDLAVEASGAPRERLLYVGDHVGDDIEGAWGAGLDAVLIDRLGHFAEAPCPRIGNLLELGRYIRFPSQPARAILFDLDGVVLDSSPAHLASWQQALAPLGIALTGQDLYPLEGMPTQPTAKEFVARFQGRTISDEEARRLAETKQRLFVGLFETAFVPGIVPLLHDLRGRGYRLGLVTGSSRRMVDRALASPALQGLFHVIVTGDEVGSGKPDPEPYRTAAERLGLPPAECLVVENSPLGTQSAKAAGMACVALETTLPAERLPEADRAFDSVRSLGAWLLGEAPASGRLP
jgi:beta-phosphoglucomutase